MKQEEVWQEGRYVMFQQPYPEEGDPAMVVLEDRGDRVLVQDVMGWDLNPTSVYLKKDLRDVDMVTALRAAIAFLNPGNNKIKVTFLMESGNGIHASTYDFRTTNEAQYFVTTRSGMIRGLKKLTRWYLD